MNWRLRKHLRNPHAQSAGRTLTYTTFNKVKTVIKGNQLIIVPQVADNAGGVI